MDIPEVLKQRIEEQLEGTKINEIVKNAQNISQRYRNNDGKGKRMLTKAEEALSYSVSRMPSTYCAVYSAMKHTLELYNEPIYTLLDVGAGTGAGTWAINELIDITQNTCLEKEKVMINLGKKLMEDTELSKTEWKEFNLITEEIPKKSDIVISSYIINELPEEERERAIEKLWDSANKVLLIIEPGTPAGFKNILQVRNILLKRGANIISPCSHQKECPINQDDWCSFYVRISRSSIHKKTKNGELSYEDEKFSYIALSKNEVEKRANRILRHPQIKSGYINLKICTESGIEEKTITKKEKDQYKMAKKLDAGDIFI